MLCLKGNIRNLCPIFLIAMAAHEEKTRAWLYWGLWILALLLIPLFYSDLVPKTWSLWARDFHLKTIGYVYVSIVIGFLFAKQYKSRSAVGT